MNLFRCLLLFALCVAGCKRAPAPAEKPPELPPAPSVATAPAAPDPSETALQQAATLKGEGKLAEARDALQSLAAAPGAADPVLAMLGELNAKIVFTGAAAPEKRDHTIVAGDTLGKLAKQFNTTIELIKKANGLSSDMIRLGDRLRIYQGQFAVEINKSANTLTVTDHGKFFKRYRVGSGQYNRTPAGEFKIMTRIERPPWFHPDGRTIPFGDPDNILGTHWLGLDVTRYGIHGTWETNSIGKQSSAGCVRLLNDDVAELYLLLPIGTPVTIRD
ncbi:MAG: LysM peptidoglycan-binding domain-containing protein [Verrucomicrobia bacterium]|nr:LysM peptidoglycan-binding domain-containing protein [Verrucomicrobiota bacterium]